jgi:site-specific DNA-methyltransferase (adenine-specific)
MSEKDVITERYSLLYGDCLERMKEIPDGSVDMILTDPPYGMDLTPQRQSGKFHNVKIANDSDLSWADEFFQQCYRVLPKTDCAGFFFCSHHSVGQFIESGKNAGFDVKNLLVWDKDWFGMGGNWRPNFELILLLTKGRFVTKSNDKSNILKYRRLSGQKMVHPTEKVIPLLEELITEPDYNPQVVLDPFSGSFTTGVACLNVGRKFVGIELNEKYFDIGVERMANYLPQSKDTIVQQLSTEQQETQLNKFLK